MNTNEYNDPKKSLVLFGLENKLDFLIKLYNSKKLPKVLMLTGKKGVGKFTLINHFLTYIFDKDNYDLKERTINPHTPFYIQYSNTIFPNIIYLSGNKYKNIKIDDIRNLKSTILKSSMINQDRFIVLDDIELFNQNSLNALLKILEEPPKKCLIMLISHNLSQLLPTILSRCTKLRFSRLSRENMDVLLEFNFPHIGDKQREFLNIIAEGRIGHAISLVDEGGLDVYEKLIPLTVCVASAVGIALI